MARLFGDPFALHGVYEQQGQQCEEHGPQHAWGRQRQQSDEAHDGRTAPHCHQEDHAADDQFKQMAVQCEEHKQGCYNPDEHSRKDNQREQRGEGAQHGPRGSHRGLQACATVAAELRGRAPRRPTLWTVHLPSITTSVAAACAVVVPSTSRSVLL